MFNKGDKVLFTKANPQGKLIKIAGEFVSQRGPNLVVEYQDGSRVKWVILHESRVEEDK